ncbi:unnamed protein product, partial [Mesorhabditis spiculigera]
MVKSPRKKMKDADSPLRTPTRPAGIEDDEMTPIKTPSRRSPRKASTPKTSTPTRTKAWGSPRKLFDLESQMNDSWADMMNAEGEDYPAPSMTQSEPRRRKGAVPKKAGTRPKFVKSIELTDALLSPKPRQAERPQPPVSASNNRKRHLSTASSMAEAEELGASPTKRANTGTPNRVPAKKKHLFAADQASPRSPQIKVKDNWAEPKAGWCTDVLVLERRTKELEKAKDKSVYKRYAEEVPKTDRVKGMHPKTPNKLLNYSRRSWDVQVRRWKRELYVWAGEEPTDSANSSFCCSDSPYYAVYDASPFCPYICKDTHYP